MKNSCGDCSLCCTWLHIKKEELLWRTTDKEVGESCEKLKNNCCSIYEDRPSLCRTFKCFWLQAAEQIEDFPLLWRPESIGLIITTKPIPEINSGAVKLLEVESRHIDINNPGPVLGKYLDFIFDAAAKQDIELDIYFKQSGEKKLLPLKRKLT